MAALVCDICGGKLVMTTGGIAVCDSCGMEYSQERMKEKIQEIKGVVRIDNTHMIDNWMKLGTAAASAGNHKEAYDYFTKVIEIDPDNWRAIFEKGKAGAWQSTLGNLRTAELYQGITASLEIINRSDIPAEDMVQIKNEFAVALYSFNNAITDLMERNLRNIDDKYFQAHWDNMWDTRQRYITNIEVLEVAMTLIADLDDDLSRRNVIEFKKRICSDICNACDSIQYWTDYSQSRLGYLGFTPEEKKPLIDKFWNLVEDIRIVEPDYKTGEFGLPDPFGPGLHLSKEIAEYWRKHQNELKRIHEEAAAKKRLEEYWKQHSDLRQQYELRLTQIASELATVNDQYAALSSKISEMKKPLSSPVPAEAQLAQIREKQSELKARKNKLGFFAGKQKKELQSQIDELETGIPNIQEEIKRQKTSLANDINVTIKPIEKDMKAVRQRLSILKAEEEKIRGELTKPR